MRFVPGTTVSGPSVPAPAGIGRVSMTVLLVSMMETVWLALFATYTHPGVGFTPTTPREDPTGMGAMTVFSVRLVRAPTGVSAMPVLGVGLLGPPWMTAAVSGKLFRT